VRFFLTAVAFIAAAAHAPSTRRYEFSSRQMGTEARIVLYAQSEDAARDATSHAFARITALDRVMSDYRDDSEVAALCRRAGSGPVEISDDLFRVLDVSQRLARESGGAFDVTVGPLTHLWRRARRLGELPDPDAVRAALALTGSDKLVLRPRAAELRTAGMQIDLGGVGKGFAAEEAIAVLKRDGIRDALVALGGDIFALGAPPDRDGWTIAVSGLRDPETGNRETPSQSERFASVSLRDAAISTSGDAEQWLEADGVRYSHILDPRTGRPITGRHSVTVVAPSGALADGLATAVTVMGNDDGLRLIESMPGCAARISTMDGGGVRTVRSKRWETYRRSTSPTDSDM
jgi:FAD:protein FMN transferase